MAWRNTSLSVRLVSFDLFSSNLCVWWAHLNRGNPNVTTNNRIETPALIHDRRMGLLTELWASFTGGHSGSEIVLVRFHRLRARRQSTRGRQNFAEASSSDGRERQ